MNGGRSSIEYQVSGLEADFCDVGSGVVLVLGDARNSDTGCLVGGAGQAGTVEAVLSRGGFSKLRNLGA